MIACSAMTPTIMGPAGNSSVIIQKGQTLLAHKCGGYDYGVDVESAANLFGSYWLLANIYRF